MIKPQDKVFANLSAQLHHDLPLEPLTRVVNLAAVALGILRSKSLQMGQIVTALPLAGIRDSLKKRVQRFLKNDSVTVDDYYQPLAKRILHRLVAGGARLHLTLDRTEWGTFNVLYVGVGWRGRALPVLWRMQGPGASSFAEQKELLAVVAAWLPQGARVLLLGDREFGTGVLAQWALKHGWDLCLRLRAHEYVRRVGTPYFEMLPLVLPGERRFWSHVAFTQAHAVAGLNLAMYWAPTAAEPWFLITTEPTCKLACASYTKRFRIEEMFKDFKNNGRGFGLELTGVRHADRLARLLLALALVYTWLLLWGAYVIASGQQKLVDNVRKPTLSLLQTGLRFVMQLWHRGQLVRFHWHLSMLTEADN
ncbi:MAG: IS4 family transposase [Planctomycetes bacterium]|nr:IS4 family transposase [Planctomycetota bacterium]